MSDQAIRAFASELASIRRRLSNLETAPRLTNASVRGGFTRWQPGNGDFHPQIAIGGGDSNDDVVLVLTDALGVTRVAVGDITGGPFVRVTNPVADGTVDIINVANGAMATPLIATGWQRDGFHTINANGNPLVSAGSYETAWRTLLPCLSGAVYANIDVIVGGGVTSCAVKMTAHEVLSGVAAVDVFETTGITTTTTLDGPWDIPTTILSPAASPIGHLVELDVQVRVTGGAGDVATVPRYPAVNWTT